MRMIIDTDAGVDDAHALMMALARPELNILAITTLTGNIGVEHVNQNVFTVLDVMERDVPVYQGANQPLVKPWQWETEAFHGTDGLGDWPDRPSTSRHLEPEHGVQTLIRLANAYPGEITLVALGPLTNVALAVRLDPTFPTKIKQLVFMGGTIAARGNTRIPSAEFNIYCDPEAAHIVLHTFPQSTMLSWETTLQHPFPLPWYDALIAIPGAHAAFLQATNAKMMQFVAGDYLLPDPLAMAAAIQPDLVIESQMRVMSVELAGTLTRGQTIIDYTKNNLRKPNIRVIQRMNLEGVYALYQQMLGANLAD
jgi:purine nucleosidase